MADLNLQASESVLMSEGDELYLTNLNIISIETIGFFKTKTVVNKYPLSQVKKVDGVPQVLLKDNLTVQVFFWQDQITLEFEKNRVAEEWATIFVRLLQETWPNSHQVKSAEGLTVRCWTLFQLSILMQDW